MHQKDDLGRKLISGYNEDVNKLRTGKYFITYTTIYVCDSCYKNSLEKKKEKLQGKDAQKSDRKGFPFYLGLHVFTASPTWKGSLFQWRGEQIFTFQKKLKNLKLQGT